MKYPTYTSRYLLLYSDITKQLYKYIKVKGKYFFIVYLYAAPGCLIYNPLTFYNPLIFTISPLWLPPLFAYKTLILTPRQPHLLQTAVKVTLENCH